MRTEGDHKVWTVEIVIDEEGDDTQARAFLDIEGNRLGGWGRAKHNPVDPRVPRIGDELAVARALSDLAHRVLEAATLEIEQFSSGAVELHG